MKVKKIPMRMCVGCKELKPKEGAAPYRGSADGAHRARTYGQEIRRGVYVCDDIECFTKPTSPMALRDP